jgi:hypothetical protein
MHKISYLLLITVTATIIVTSCGKKAATEAKYIPKDVTGVIVVDPLSLKEKMSKGNISVDSFLLQFQKKSDTAGIARNKKLWEEFKENGINLDRNLYVFFVQKGSLQKGQSSAYSFMGNMKDETKFQAYLKKQEDTKNKAISKGKNYNYLQMSDENIIAWNQEVVIVTWYNKVAKFEYDSLGNYKAPDESTTKLEVQQEVERYFSLKESESVVSVTPFNNMFNEKADGYIFNSSSAALTSLSAMPLSLPKLETLLKDNYSTTTFNFEDGKIVAKGITQTNPMLASILKKYAGPTVNMAAIENFPATNINGVMMAAFNPELFNGVLKELEVSALIDGFLSKQGLTSADFFKAMKGEINVFVGDFKLETKETNIPMPDGSSYNNKSQMPSVKMIFTASIGDKVAFTKLMNKAAESGAVMKTKSGYAAGDLLKMANLFLVSDEKNIVLASDSLTYVAYQAANTKAKIDVEIMDKMKGKSTTMFMDINSIMNGLLQSTQEKSFEEGMKLVNATFKDMVFTMDNFDGKTIKSEGEIRMTNTKQNSLVSVMQMISGIFKIMNEDRPVVVSDVATQSMQ